MYLCLCLPEPWPIDLVKWLINMLSLREEVVLFSTAEAASFPAPDQ